MELSSEAALVATEMPILGRVVDLRPALVPLVMGGSLAIGLLVPSVYEFSLPKAARHTHPGKERAAIAVLTLAAIAGALRVARRLAVLSETPVPQPRSWRLQFGLRELLGGLTLTGVLLALALYMKQVAASCLVGASVIAVLGWVMLRSDRQSAKRLLTTLAAIFLPFAWAILYSVPIGHTSGLASFVPLAPGILLAVPMRAFFDMNVDEATPPSAVLVILLIVFSAWLARAGGATFVIWTTLLLFWSTANSLLFHALYRA